MNRMIAASFVILVLLSGTVCLKAEKTKEEKKMNSFGDDVEFLKKYVDVIVLSSPDGKAKTAVVGAYQGRIMTSTADGNDGMSFGWINYDLIESGKTLEHINPYGGEERFWMGPEGGQYAIYFDKGDSFEFKDWQVPAFIDTEPFELVSKTGDSAVFKRDVSITNYSGTKFDLRIDRTVRLLDSDKVSKIIGVEVPSSVKMVAVESENKVTNTGKEAWTKDKGLLSIWILCMLNPSPTMTVVIPFKEGPESELGPKVNDAYFGKVPADRLIVRDNVLYFKGDGTMRGKIGISPQRAKPFAGSYDKKAKVLTLVNYTLPEGVTDYVNSMWEVQKKPYAGDVVNSYNDGPPEPGARPLGPFYELETSSPALALQPGESAGHVHRTMHFVGKGKDLNPITEKTLGVKIKEIKMAFESGKDTTED